VELEDVLAVGATWRELAEPAGRAHRQSDMKRSLPLVILLIALLVGGCAAGPAGSSGPTASPARPGMIGAGLVVSITDEGGLMSPVDALMQGPDLALYADGRLFEPVALPTVYPGPFLPSIHQFKVTAAGIQRVLDLARADGLTGHDQDYPATSVADAPDTVVTVVVGGQPVTSRFAALGAGTAASDPAEQVARTGAQDFVTKLRGNTAYFGSTDVGSERQYIPDVVQVVAVQGDPSAGVQPSEMVRAPLAWPLATPLSEFGVGLQAGSPAAARCGMVSGSDLQILWPLFEQATQISGFSSAGTTWTLTPRLLLPGEPGSCGLVQP
jgi:hypothetical protein